MRTDRTSQKKDSFVKWMLLGIPILFVLATPLHFLFERSNQTVIVGVFAPVNESPWEHLKLTFWPLLIWFIIGYLLFGRKQKGACAKYALSCVVAEIVCALFILSFFYTYQGALGIKSHILNILALLLGLIISILVSIHVYKYAKPSTLDGVISILILILLAILFIYLTFYPPHIPLFQDSLTGTYGIPGSISPLLL